MLRAVARRLKAVAGPAITTDAVKSKLVSSHLNPTAVHVEDISGGCGSFFKVTVESTAFNGKTLVAQHRLVNEVLKAEIAEMHGITVITKVPK